MHLPCVQHLFSSHIIHFKLNFHLFLIPCQKDAEHLKKQHPEMFAEILVTEMFSN